MTGWWYTHCMLSQSFTKGMLWKFTGACPCLQGLWLRKEGEYERIKAHDTHRFSHAALTIWYLRELMGYGEYFRVRRELLREFKALLVEPLCKEVTRVKRCHFSLQHKRNVTCRWRRVQHHVFTSKYVTVKIFHYKLVSPAFKISQMRTNGFSIILLDCSIILSDY